MFMDKAPQPLIKNIESLPEIERIKIQEIRNLVVEIADTDIMAWNELMVSLRALRKDFDDADNYSELYKYKLWHACIGSSIIPEKMPQMDLPGNIIENMVREKRKTLGSV